MSTFRIAVVGSGPSGSYCAQLLSEESDLPIEVDVFEQLPAPFGLVRYGVAPDHPKIKSITMSFSEVFEETPGVRLLGNVRVGVDITSSELRSHYDGVVFASGAPLDRRLGVPGEDLAGAHAVRDFVSWYGGHPDTPSNAFVLDGHRAVVIGVGNVALDAARMLVRTTEDLRATDVPQHIVEAFTASTFSEVVIVGRRGPAYAKFTNKEFIELLDLENCDVIIDPDDLELDAAQQEYLDSNPAATRLFASFRKAAERGALGRKYRIRFVFDRTPVEFLGEDGSVSGVRLAKTSDPTVTETLDTELVFRSVGYMGKAVPGLPFDTETATVPHRDSRVIDGEEEVPGVYIAGWIKRGPTGVVGTNRRCALDTVTSILEDIGSKSSSASTSTVVDELLRSRGVQVVDWAAWRRIDEAERAAGESTGRERVKLHDRNEMLQFAADDVIRLG
ncbi:MULTISPECIES: FAD-dependent oxidoreductase [Rhodococcus]|uniref:FAD-dependent oxidoreductase n=1 Tax=Rhodococcus globerulus TaxID=33008 RepID=UPI001C582124|nr:FAD-dependent oxidoreductase [Rhodococcus globerulus]QXW05206.1 FAD-dependent oxidoreductase [Rhodococcus globerulus]